MLLQSTQSSAKVTQENNTTIRKEYCYQLPFRETPAAEVRCIFQVSPEQAKKRKHIELSYNANNQLISIKNKIGNKLKDFDERWVRSAFTKIKHSPSGKKETRLFYNELGHRTLVSGDVYFEVFEKNEYGQYISLRFFGLDNKPVQNHFGISHYQWSRDLQGRLVEKRYNLKNEITTNRPGFGYEITRFVYDERGLLTRMENLGKKGEQPTPDKAGVVYTQINYDQFGYFKNWINLDKNGNRIRGMSDISEIEYILTPYGEIETAFFWDADNTPQATRWGAHKRFHEYDDYGNLITDEFYDTKLNKAKTTFNVSQRKMSYSDDGHRETSLAFYDSNESLVEHKNAGYALRKTDLTNKAATSTVRYFNADLQPVNHAIDGYHKEQWFYDKQGRIISKKYFNKEGHPAINSFVGFHEIKIEYFDDDNLKSVGYFGLTNEPVRPSWNPVH